MQLLLHYPVTVVETCKFGLLLMEMLYLLETIPHASKENPMTSGIYVRKQSTVVQFLNCLGWSSSGTQGIFQGSAAEGRWCLEETRLRNKLSCASPLCLHLFWKPVLLVSRWYLYHSRVTLCIYSLCRLIRHIMTGMLLSRGKVMDAQRIWNYLSCLLGPEAKRNRVDFSQTMTFKDEIPQTMTLQMNILIQVWTVFFRNKVSLRSFKTEFPLL